MTATAHPFGFRPVGYLGGRSYNGAVREYKILSGYTTAIGEGDIVRLGGSADTTSEGYLVKETGTAALTKPLGVFVGCSYTDPNTGQVIFRNSYPSGGVVASDIIAKVVDDPDAVFEVQADGPIDQAEIGQNSALVQGAGVSAFGISSHTLAAGSTTTDTLPFRIVGVVPRPGNVAGDAYTIVHVCWNAGIQAFRVATSR